MGLDMYLSTVKKEGNKKTIELVVSWRKVNAIHKWFVDNVQNGIDDCEEYYLDENNLKDLLRLCEYTIKTKDTSGLPTTEGCFFGNLEYNDQYFNDLQYTVDELTKVLNDHKDIDYFIYQSSW